MADIEVQQTLDGLCLAQLAVLAAAPVEGAVRNFRIPYGLALNAGSDAWERLSAWLRNGLTAFVAKLGAWTGTHAGPRILNGI